MASSPPIRVSQQFRDENPDADASATEVVMNALVVGHALLDAMDRTLRPHGLTTAAFNLLQIVAGADEPLTPTEIARRVNAPVTTATMSGLLDTCQRKGLVQRQPHPGDGRRVLVHITPAGRALLAVAARDVFALERRLVGPLPDARRETLVRALGELRGAIEAAREPTG